YAPGRASSSGRRRSGFEWRRLRAWLAPFLAKAEDNWADFAKAGLALDGAEFVGHARHAVDDATAFVLADRAGAGVAHRFQAGGAVAAHAGHDHPNRPGPGGLGDGVEE